MTKLEIAKPEGRTQAWIPLPSVNEQDWFQSNGSQWTHQRQRRRSSATSKYGAEMLHVEWAEGEKAPVVEVTSRIATRDRAVDLAKPGKRRAAVGTPSARSTLDGTDLIPVDGIVKQTSDKIVAGAKTDIEKARAIYEWVVDNTFRDAKTRGCGIGDIAAMLKTGNLGGKCADLNALYVGLARAAGLPARDVYGIRVAPSKFGYKSLGAGSEIITKAQHCRAEVYLSGFGWVPVDPADVRKVVLEEPPANLAINDPKVVAARKTLFGAWETQLARLQLRARRRAAGLDGPEARLPDVSAGRDRQHAARLSRSGQLQIHDHVEGIERGVTPCGRADRRPLRRERRASDTRLHLEVAASGTFRGEGTFSMSRRLSRSAHGYSAAAIGVAWLSPLLMAQAPIGRSGRTILHAEHRIPAPRRKTWARPAGPAAIADRPRPANTDAPAPANSPEQAAAVRDRRRSEGSAAKRSRPTRRRNSAGHPHCRSRGDR